MSQVIVIDAPPSFRRISGKQEMKLMSSTDFIRALGRTGKGAGLLI